jgi:hypothetical protein
MVDTANMATIVVQFIALLIPATAVIVNQILPEEPTSSQADAVKELLKSVKYTYIFSFISLLLLVAFYSNSIFDLDIFLDPPGDYLIFASLIFAVIAAGGVIMITVKGFDELYLISD